MTKRAIELIELMIKDYILDADLPMNERAEFLKGIDDIKKELENEHRSL